jgi:hypothetical protein
LRQLALFIQAFIDPENAGMVAMEFIKRKFLVYIDANNNATGQSKR